MNVNVAQVWNTPGKSMISDAPAYVNLDVIYQGAGLEEPRPETRNQLYLSYLAFDQCGLFGDREFMWVEAEPHTNVEYQKGQIAQPGQFISQREDRVLTNVVAEMMIPGEYAFFSLRTGEEDLHLDIAKETDKNTIPVSVWGWNGRGVDQGQEAAEWGSKVIGRPVRLVSVSKEHPRYVEDNPSLGRVGFADGFPLLVASSESVAQVNQWLNDRGDESVPADRFRANILLDGLEPFQEDYINRLEVVKNGLTMTLRRAKACGRCPIPDTDQETGERGRSVRSVLGKNRRGVHADTAKYGNSKEIFFGQHFVIEMPADMPAGDTIELYKGDSVEAVMSEAKNWRTA